MYNYIFFVINDKMMEGSWKSRSDKNNYVFGVKSIMYILN